MTMNNDDKTSSFTADRKRKAPIDTTNNDADDTGKKEEAIRRELKAHHASLKKEILGRHARELNEFETMMQREQEEDFDTCEFVVSAREKIAKSESLLIGFCAVCRTTPLKMDGKDFDEQENGERDEWDVTDFDGEKCRYCELTRDEDPSIKCDTCAWPILCSLSTKKKDVDEHGFCQPCINKLSKCSGTEAMHKFDIPMRDDPGDPGEFLERDHMHPFLMCDCGICAWCGHDMDHCCTDHVYQLCSCFPETF